MAARSARAGPGGPGAHRFLRLIAIDTSIKFSTATSIKLRTAGEENIQLYRGRGGFLRSRSDSVEQVDGEVESEVESCVCVMSMEYSRPLASASPVVVHRK